MITVVLVVFPETIEKALAFHIINITPIKS